MKKFSIIALNINIGLWLCLLIISTLFSDSIVEYLNFWEFIQCFGGSYILIFFIGYYLCDEVFNMDLDGEKARKSEIERIRNENYSILQKGLKEIDIINLFGCNFSKSEDSNGYCFLYYDGKTRYMFMFLNNSLISWSRYDY